MRELAGRSGAAKRYETTVVIRAHPDFGAVAGERRESLDN
jgi:hypothetical protein